MEFGLSGCGGGLEPAGHDRLHALAQLADGLGYTALWINEEHFQRSDITGRGRRCLSPVVLAAMLAGQTQRIRLGFSVLLLPLHQPLRLAEEIATLDVLSGGRVDFGISRGTNQRYAAAFGAAGLDQTEAFRDGLSFILRCWSEGPVVIGSQEFDVVPKPLQRPHPPVYIGAYSEESVRWAGASGHALIQHGIQSLSSVREALRCFIDAGGDVSSVPIGRFVYVGETDEEARRVAWPVVCQLTDRLRTIGIHRRGRIISEPELDPERFYREVAIIGSPATCIDRIAALRDELGMRYLNCLAGFFGILPEADLRRSLELFAREVMVEFS